MFIPTWVLVLLAIWYFSSNRQGSYAGSGCLTAIGILFLIGFLGYWAIIIGAIAFIINPVLGWVYVGGVSLLIWWISTLSTSPQKKEKQKLEHIKTKKRWEKYPVMRVFIYLFFGMGFGALFLGLMEGITQSVVNRNDSPHDILLSGLIFFIILFFIGEYLTEKYHSNNQTP